MILTNDPARATENLVRLIEKIEDIYNTEAFSATRIEVDRKKPFAKELILFSQYGALIPLFIKINDRYVQFDCKTGLSPCAKTIFFIILTGCLRNICNLLPDLQETVRTDENLKSYLLSTIDTLEYLIGNLRQEVNELVKGELDSIFKRGDQT